MVRWSAIPDGRRRKSEDLDFSPSQPSQTEFSVRYEPESQRFFTSLHQSRKTGTKTLRSPLQRIVSGGTSHMRGALMG